MDREMLLILACPKCKAGIKKRGMFVVCSGCRLAFPVTDGVPDMLLEDAWQLERAREHGFRHSIKL